MEGFEFVPRVEFEGIGRDRMKDVEQLIFPGIIAPGSVLMSVFLRCLVSITLLFKILAMRAKRYRKEF